MNAPRAMCTAVFCSIFCLAMIVHAQSPPTELPGYRVVIRIDQSLLEPLHAQEIDHVGRIDQVVLGTRAIGESHTTGKIDVETVPNQADVRFKVRFSGRTQTRTTGYNGPALIYSRTNTDFVCTRQVAFDSDKGFVASPCKLQAKTSLVYEGFGSSREGLGSRLIARIARKRANELHAAALQIAGRDNREEVRQEFDDRLDNQLANLNREFATLRYVNAALNLKSKPQLIARSGSNCICVGFGREEGSGRGASIPPERDRAAPLEIWIHSSVLGDRSRGIVGLMGRMERSIVPAPLPLSVSQLSMGSTDESLGPIDLELCEGWIVVSMRGKSSTFVSSPIVPALGQTSVVRPFALPQR